MYPSANPRTGQFDMDAPSPVLRAVYAGSGENVMAAMVGGTESGCKTGTGCPSLAIAHAAGAIMNLAVRRLLFAMLLPWLPMMPALACSIHTDPERPSAFDIVSQADAIIVGRVQDSLPARPDWGKQPLADGLVAFKPLEVLKGKVPAFVGVSGRIEGLWTDGPGMCKSHSFERVETYLLVLEDRGDHFMARGYAKASGTSIWLAGIQTPLSLVRTFARLQQEGDGDQQWRSLEDMLKQRLHIGASPQEQAEARHILDHLRSISAHHTTGRLIALYHDLAAHRIPSWGLRTTGGYHEKWDDRPWAQVVRDPSPIIDDPSFPEKDDWEAMQRMVLEKLARPGHDDAEPFFRQILAERPHGSALIEALAFLAWHGKRVEATDLMYRYYFALLDTRPAETYQLGVLARAMDGPPGREKDEAPAWRDDPVLAARWPELAFRFRKDLGDEWGRAFTDAASAIQVADYRRDGEKTRLLAAMFEPAVQAWAKSELSDKARARNWFSQPVTDDAGKPNPALLPIQVLVASYYQDSASPELFELYCQGNGARLLLLTALGSDLRVLYLAERIGASQQLTELERLVLARSLAQIYTRKQAQPMSHTANASFAMLTALLRGERFETEAKPISCQ
ncbi:hypothetical protein [Niveispirillum sp. KHB5.9]|uniref:hypothetical protein n=1 Tax=Niveispirillum sp. KHB5.9 TaxID=3400269 RepID=UPI003A84D33B